MNKAFRDIRVCPTAGGGALKPETFLLQ